VSLYRAALERSMLPGARRPDALTLERAEAVCEAALREDLALDGVHSWGDGSVCLSFGDQARRVALTIRGDGASTRLDMDAALQVTRATGFDLDHLASEMSLVALYLRRRSFR